MLDSSWPWWAPGFLLYGKKTIPYQVAGIKGEECIGKNFILASTLTDANSVQWDDTISLYALL